MCCLTYRCCCCCCCMCCPAHHCACWLQVCAALYIDLSEGLQIENCLAEHSLAAIQVSHTATSSHTYTLPPALIRAHCHQLSYLHTATSSHTCTLPPALILTHWLSHLLSHWLSHWLSHQHAAAHNGRARQQTVCRARDLPAGGCIKPHTPGHLSAVAGL